MVVTRQWEVCHCMGVRDFQGMSDQKENGPPKIITSLVKILGHGFIVLIGFILLHLYFFILNLNFWLGSYILFLPYVILLAIPLVFILIGALNSYSVRFIYRRKTDEQWSSLLLEGILVGFIGVLYFVAFFTLLSYVPSPWLLFLYTSGWSSIIFYVLLIPPLGYITKKATIAFFTNTKGSENI